MVFHWVWATAIFHFRFHELPAYLLHMPFHSTEPAFHLNCWTIFLVHWPPPGCEVFPRPLQGLIDRGVDWVSVSWGSCFWSNFYTLDDARGCIASWKWGVDLPVVSRQTKQLNFCSKLTNEAASYFGALNWRALLSSVRRTCLLNNPLAVHKFVHLDI